MGVLTLLLVTASLSLAHDDACSPFSTLSGKPGPSLPSYTPKAQIRKPAPNFSATAWSNGKFTKSTLSDYIGKYVVLFFYPLDFTFVCPTEILSFNDYADEFEKNDAVLLGISVDSHYVHREYTLKSREHGGLGPIKIPLLSDLDKSIGKDYGVYLDFSDDAGVNLRGTFIIDRSGILRHSSINDLPVGRNIPEILRLVQAFQYTDRHGEVCPSAWSPGSATLVPDHESDRLQEYWRTQLSRPKAKD